MRGKARNIVLPALFTALMVVGALLKINLSWVPISFQTFFAIFCGLLLPWKQALAAQLLYIALGLSGIPVFAGGGGISYIFAPTFGYILGFAACSAAAALIKDLWGGLRGFLLAAVLGLAANYAVGLPYLYFSVKFLSGNGGFTLAQAIAAGLTPFIAKDFLLAAVAALIAARVKRAVKSNWGQ